MQKEKQGVYFQVRFLFTFTFFEIYTYALHIMDHRERSIWSWCYQKAAAFLIGRCKYCTRTWTHGHIGVSNGHKESVSVTDANARVSWSGNDILHDWQTTCPARHFCRTNLMASKFLDFNLCISDVGSKWKIGNKGKFSFYSANRKGKSNTCWYFVCRQPGLTKKYVDGDNDKAVTAVFKLSHLC